MFDPLRGRLAFENIFISPWVQPMAIQGSTPLESFTRIDLNYLIISFEKMSINTISTPKGSNFSIALGVTGGKSDVV